MTWLIKDCLKCIEKRKTHSNKCRYYKNGKLLYYDRVSGAFDIQNCNMFNAMFVDDPIDYDYEKYKPLEFFGLEPSEKCPYLLEILLIKNM